MFLPVGRNVCVKIPKLKVFLTGKKQSLFRSFLEYWWRYFNVFEIAKRNYLFMDMRRILLTVYIFIHIYLLLGLLSTFYGRYNSIFFIITFDLKPINIASSSHMRHEWHLEQRRSVLANCYIFPDGRR